MKRANQQSLFQFDADLKRFAKQINVDVGTVVKRVVLELHNKIVLRTPVDTGRARASWGISVGEVGGYVAPPRGKKVKGSKAAATMEAQNKAAPMKAIPPEAAVGKKFYIFNNLPYIKPLEYGHSKQAPAGMVRVAMAEVAAQLLNTMRGGK